MPKSTSLIEKWTKMLKRRVDRWWGLDPEFKHYLPEHQKEYRTPSPSSQEDVAIPRQAFIKNFHIKYYQQDFRRGAGWNPEHIDTIVYRQEVIENAQKGKLKLMPGQPVGPFYGMDMDKKAAYVIDERENKQVYTYNVDRYVFKPESATSLEQIAAENEAQKLYANAQKVDFLGKK
ncbi:hypothetical protein FDP41_007764 [Naegleria fowleri]|uniref:Uncharacterized protein n=1 Tax=Naegleria fowleri TaxID=5763 RepID=A0A6A5CEV2_NAEFO|nr:uncharacterized protein FDP41_007764 [Naegleria fowleri]KAF0983849.1 hypothetical protein FDP41_007764 [Naegleria fowleri]CAG4714076.1 unnamed protein product [Naegleria fowleri]